MALILVLTNQSQLAPLSDYNYQVLVGDGTLERSTLLARGTILQHERAAGWRTLVRRLLEDVAAAPAEK